jgi:hypothetical protein
MHRQPAKRKLPPPRELVYDVRVAILGIGLAFQFIAASAPTPTPAMPDYVAAVIEKVEPGYSAYQRHVTIKLDKVLYGPATRTYTKLRWLHCYEGHNQDTITDGFGHQRPPALPKIGAHVIMQIDEPTSPMPRACDNFVYDDTPAARTLTYNEATEHVQALEIEQHAAAFKAQKAGEWAAMGTGKAPKASAVFQALATISSPAYNPTTRLALVVQHSITGQKLNYGDKLTLALPPSFVGHPLLYRENELLSQCLIVSARSISKPNAKGVRTLELAPTSLALLPCTASK